MNDVNKAHKRKRSISDPNTFGSVVYTRPIISAKEHFIKSGKPGTFTKQQSYILTKKFPVSVTNLKCIDIVEPKIEKGYHIRDLINRNAELKKIKKLTKKFNSIFVTDCIDIEVKLELENHHAIITAEIENLKEDKSDIFNAINTLNSPDIEFRLYLILDRLCKYKKDLEYKNVYVMFDNSFYLHLITNSTNPSNITIDIKVKPEKMHKYTLSRSRSNSLDKRKSTDCGIM